MLYYLLIYIFLFFFFNDTATTEIYTLSLHDALPIYVHFNADAAMIDIAALKTKVNIVDVIGKYLSLKKEGIEFVAMRSEEHTSELQSQFHLVCRLLLEKKKKKKKKNNTIPNNKTITK